MTEHTSPTTNETAPAPSKGLHIGLWVVQVLLAAAFLASAAGKLTGQPQMVDLFEKIGVGQWFRYVTGITELVAAVLLLVPRARVVGAALLVCVMLGATATHLLVLHDPPIPALVLGGLAGFVLWGRRAEMGRLRDR